MGDDVHELLAGDVVEHVCKVEEDRGSCWELVSLLWPRDVLLNAKLYCLDYKVHASANTNGVIEQEHINGKSLTVGDYYVTGGEPSHSGGDVDGSELGGIIWVLV